MKLPDPIQFQGSAESRGFKPVEQASPTRLIAENTDRLLAGQARNFQMEDQNLQGVFQVERNNQRVLFSQLKDFSSTAATFVADWAKRDAENIEIGQYYDALLEGTDVTVERQREQQAENQAVAAGDAQGEQVSRFANDVEARTGDPMMGQMARESFGGLARGVQGERALLMRASTSYGAWLATFLESDGYVTIGGNRMSIREAANSGDSRLVSAVIAAGRGAFIRENGLQHTTKKNFVEMLGQTIISSESAIAGAAVRAGIKAQREENITRLEGLGYDLARTTDSSGVQDAYNNLSAQFFRSNTGMSRGAANEAAIKALIAGYEDAGNTDALEALLDVQSVPGQAGTELRTRYGNLLNDAITRARGVRDDLDGRVSKDLEASMYESLAGAQTQQQRDVIIENTAQQMESAGLFQQARQLRQQRDELAVAGSNELNTARLEEGLRTGSFTAKDVENARLRGDITSSQAASLLRDSGGGLASGEDQLKDPLLKGTLDSYGDSFDAYFLGKAGLKRNEFGKLLPGQSALLTTEEAEVISQQARNDLRLLASQVLTTYADQSIQVKQQKLHEAFKEWMREQVKTPEGKYYVNPNKVKDANGVEGYDPVNQRYLRNLANSPGVLANPRVGTNSSIAPKDWSSQVGGGQVTASVRSGFRRLRGDKVFTEAEVKNYAQSFNSGVVQQSLINTAQGLGMSPLALLQQQSAAYGLEPVRGVSMDLQSSSNNAPKSAVEGAQMLMQMGVPAKGAAWLAGNIQTESTWNGQQKPWDDGGALAGGLVSWRAGRLTNAQRALGGDITKASTDAQLRYMLQEMKTRYPAAYATFMNPRATDRMLMEASRNYWGWGVQGSRFENAVQIESALQRRRGRPQSQISGSAAQRTIQVGRDLLSRGIRMWQHPNFDIDRGFVAAGNARVGGHAENSHHNYGEALDIPLSHNSAAKLDELYRFFNANRRRYGISELLWRVPGHHTHLHIAFSNN